MQAAVHARCPTVPKECRITYSLVMCRLSVFLTAVLCLCCLGLTSGLDMGRGAKPKALGEPGQQPTGRIAEAQALGFAWDGHQWICDGCQKSTRASRLEQHSRARPAVLLGRARLRSSRCVVPVVTGRGHWGLRSGETRVHGVPR